MSIAVILLLVSIASVPALAIFDGVVAQSITSALAAAALAFVGVSARAADVNFAARATGRLQLAAAVPALWMVVQILPMPVLSHSIWNYANEALNQKSWGHISVDVGSTFGALAFYLANVSLIVVGLFVARDRRRAELILFTLPLVVSLTVIVLLISKPIASRSIGEINEVLGAVSSLGIILWLSSGMRALERYESRKADGTRPAHNVQIALAACGIGLLFCFGALVASATLNGGLAVLFGVATFVSIQAIRRVSLPSWAVGIFIATMIAAATMIILWRYDASRVFSPFLQFASSASSGAISMAQRMLSDTNWQGTGAATYASLLSLYQELGSSYANPPSTASKFAIEMGWPMTIFVIATTLGLIVLFYRSALSRGRDSFYPAAAAACLVLILCQAFCDASLLNSGVAVISDAVIGLGLAQSISQRERP